MLRNLGLLLNNAYFGDKLHVWAYSVDTACYKNEADMEMPNFGRKCPDSPDRFRRKSAALGRKSFSEIC